MTCSFQFNLCRPAKKRWLRLRRLPRNYWILAAVTFPPFTSYVLKIHFFYRCRQGFGDRAFSCSEETKKQSITSYLAHGAAHTGSQNFQLLYSNQWFQKHMFKELAAVEKCKFDEQSSGKYWPKAERGRREKEEYWNRKVGKLFNPCKRWHYFFRIKNLSSQLAKIDIAQQKKEESEKAKVWDSSFLTLQCAPHLALPVLATHCTLSFWDGFSIHAFKSRVWYILRRN